MKKNVVPIFLIILSDLGGYLAQAAFTPAIIINVSMIAAGLTRVVKKRHILALTLFAINSVAIYWFSLMM